MFFLINNLARYIEEHISVNNKTPETLKHPDIRIFIEQQLGKKYLKCTIYMYVRILVNKLQLCQNSKK